MFVPFFRTTSSLKAEHSQLAVFFIATIALVLAGWSIWLVQGRVAVYAISQSARIESAQASHPVQSLYTGRVAINHLVLGKRVSQGDVLIELDANVQRLQLFEEQLQNPSIETELEVLKREIAAEQSALNEAQKAGDVGLQEAKARQQEAEVTASYAESEVDRLSRLQAAGLIASSELSRTRAEAEKQRSSAEIWRLAAERQQWANRVSVNERRSRIESLKRELTRLSAQRAKAGAAVNRLESELHLRRIVSSVDGVVGEVAPLKVGGIINAGEKLGAIIPFGGLKVVAQFSPAATLGRIQKGQPARLRLDGFPWTQYGAIGAVVADVANEARDGHIRVEFEPESATGVELQHGLPGIIEVEVEHLSPIALLLRVAGRIVAPRQADLLESQTAATSADEGLQ
jgi:membrane fusion protein (multidrug efflux system)